MMNQTTPHTGRGNAHTALSGAGDEAVFNTAKAPMPRRERQALRHGVGRRQRGEVAEVATDSAVTTQQTWPRRVPADETEVLSV